MSSFEQYQNEESTVTKPFEEEYRDNSEYRLEGLEQQTTPTQSQKGKRKSNRSHSGSDTETGPRKMPSGSSKPSSSSGSKKSGSSSKGSSKNDDWSEVTDPEERRRIQNRIAQRKFRGKAKEAKEKSERDQRNQENAGSSYRVPAASDMTGEDDTLSSLSGLPWGGVNMRYVVERGHEGNSQGSPQLSSDQAYGENNQYLSPFGGGGYQQHGGSSWDDSTGTGTEDQQQYYDYDQQNQYSYYDYGNNGTGQ